MSLRLDEDLEGFGCLRCDAWHPVGDYFEGCPRCAAGGHAASLVARYRHYRPVLPIRGPATLGEAGTPLVPLPALAEELNLGSVELKAEYLNPTGSHKDRMSRFAVARAAMEGWEHVAAASSGNAGVSLAAYAAHQGLACTILVKTGTGEAWVRAMERYGARIEILPTRLARWSRLAEMVESGDVFPVTNFRVPAVGSNPFGVEGYKQVGHELYRQTGGAVDVILVPTCRGDLLWGIWAGLQEAAGAASWRLETRLVAVEPFPRLSRVLRGEDYRLSCEGRTRQISTDGSTVTWQSVHTLRDSGGWAVEVNDRDALFAQRALRARGIALELCAAATVPAVRTLSETGRLGPGARAVLLATSDGRYEAEIPGGEGEDQA